MADDLYPRFQKVVPINPDQLDGQIIRNDFLGLNTLRVRVVTGDKASSGTVTVNNYFRVRFTLQTRPAVRSIPLLMLSVYTDTDNNAAYRWPDGSSLTNANHPRVEWMLNQAATDADVGVYAWDVRLQNRGSGSHTYYVYPGVLLPLAVDGAITNTSA